jgi:TM2 domain-containing membrane protein YozV
MEGRLRNRHVAASLAFLGAALPLSGLHKFYLGQPGWGMAYLLLSWTPFPRIASTLEGLWYLSQGEAGFKARFGPAETVAVPDKAEQVSAIATALRELDQLRQEGLITEYEFEQKRRTLLDQVG